MLYILAMLTMLLDHIGYMFLPGVESLRIIGRLAMPLYAYFLVQAFKFTSDKRNYIKRLFWLATLSQVPYILALGKYNLNVIFTLLIAFIVLRLLETRKYIFIPFLFIISEFADYGMFLLFSVLIYQYATKRRFLYHLLLCIAFAILKGWYIQFYTLIATLIIYKDFLPHFKINKYFYRLFYPAHLLILYILLKI